MWRDGDEGKPSIVGARSRDLQLGGVDVERKPDTGGGAPSPWEGACSRRGCPGHEARPTFVPGTRERSRPDNVRISDSLTRCAHCTRAEGEDAIADPETLRPLFFPRSVAVMGASRDPEAVGHRVVTALLRAGFQGPIYPVNPSADAIGGVPAHPSLSSVGRPVDLAVVTVPATRVSDVVEDCAEAGVRALVVVTAGYAEVGAEGKERQASLVAQARSHGMRLVGPNCLGVMRTDAEVRLNASFAPDLPPPGRVAFCSQSGALGVAVIALAREIGLGMSTFVSIGNRADVSGNDLLEYWETDDGTDVILYYLESFGDPRRFARLARRLGRRKPIVVVKSGRSEAGRRAASSHTAALTSPDTAVEALVRQAGIIRADTLQEMFHVARTLVHQPLPRGRRVAVLTNAGGPAILCVDALQAAGLEVPELSDEVKEALRRFLPPEASVRNPVDMIAAAGPEEYRRAISVLLADNGIDALVILHTPVGVHSAEAMAGAVCEGLDEGRRRGGDGKPVLASIVGTGPRSHALTSSEGEVVPAFLFPEEIGATLGKVTRYAEWRATPDGQYVAFGDQALEDARDICRQAMEERGSGWLGAGEARAVLEAAGVTTTPGGVAGTAGEAVALADAVGYPVALKLASTRLVHKTEVGGVRLRLEDAEAVRSAFQEMQERLKAEGQGTHMEGALVQPMLAGTAEIMIGARADRLFGHILAFGLGGIHVEILRDVSFRVAPLTDLDTAEMVRDIRGFRLLEGYRGHPSADVPALEDALQRISRLVEAVPEIEEMDLNPVFALEPGRGYRVADVRIRVA
ncbi:MAG: acetate--CoA ligase family protein [Gemmatimonadota bacterium]|nr:acetate--CoA ligase family protein [Gemmatimonadota bacterium]